MFQLHFCRFVTTSVAFSKCFGAFHHSDNCGICIIANTEEKSFKFSEKTSFKQEIYFQ